MAQTDDDRVEICQRRDRESRADSCAPDRGVIRQDFAPGGATGSNDIELNDLKRRNVGSVGSSDDLGEDDMGSIAIDVRDMRRMGKAQTMRVKYSQ